MPGLFTTYKKCYFCAPIQAEDGNPEAMVRGPDTNNTTNTTRRFVGPGIDFLADFETVAHA